MFHNCIPARPLIAQKLLMTKDKWYWIPIDISNCVQAQFLIGHVPFCKFQNVLSTKGKCISSQTLSRWVDFLTIIIVIQGQNSKFSFLNGNMFFFPGRFSQQVSLLKMGSHWYYYCLFVLENGKSYFNFMLVIHRKKIGR